MSQTMMILFGGVGALLVLASLIGFVLSRRVACEQGRATVDNLNARIKAWWVMVAIFAVAFVFGRGVTIVLFALVSFYCLREFLSITPTRPEDHRAIVVAFYLFIPLQYWLIWAEWQTLFTILIPVWAFLLLPVLAVMQGETRDFLQRSARIQWALMLTVFCISHAPALLILDIPGFDEMCCCCSSSSPSCNCRTCCNMYSASCSGSTRWRPASARRRPGKGWSVAGFRQ